MGSVYLIGKGDEIMLTQNQVKVLRMIINYLGENEIGPTNEEIEKRLNVNWSSEVCEYMDKLERLGCIIRDDRMPRSIVVTDEGKKLVKLLDI